MECKKGARTFLFSNKKSSTTWIDSKFAQKSISEVLFCIWPLQVPGNWAYWYHTTPKFKVLDASWWRWFLVLDSEVFVLEPWNWARQLVSSFSRENHTLRSAKHRLTAEVTSLCQVSQQTETLQTQFVDWNCTNLKLASCFQTSCFVVVFFPTGTVCHEELVCQASVALKCFVLCQRFGSLARNCRESTAGKALKETHNKKTVRYL